jgi:DNA-directed RNA polymerase subunit L
MPSIVLTKEEHLTFTAAWKQAIGYNKSRATIKTSTAKKEEILNAARDIYQDYQELLKVIEEAFK